MTFNTDPTFLRTIVDGLSSGALQKDNPSALPEGLVGVYEEAIPPVTIVIERKKFLEFFGVWALMKKEVSAEFVVSLLNDLSEEEVLAFISRYSKWFNSPASGLYALYHERFRAFVLQKISGSQLLEINNRVIKSCNDALTRQLKDEWERYALEFLSAHLVMPSLENNNRGNELKELAYSTTYWNRQIEVSKGFDWSKRLLNDMMLWASKYDDDQVIECALNKVDLHHMELNDAPRIVELIAKNDIESALRRIETFGGSDQEGMRRKFTLYMLCLMELTLLGGKGKPFRKTAIDSLLRHLDENLPTDYSVLKWNDFFPSYLMFQVACECAALGVDYGVLYKRTDDWETDWIAEKGPYTDLQFRVLRECARGIRYERYMSQTLTDIAVELSKQGQVVESLAIARGISDDDHRKSSALKAIAVELSKQGQVEESLAIARGISDDFWKFSALMDIAVELSKQGQVEESASLMQESMAISRGISDDDHGKSRALLSIAVELSKQGQVEESASVMRESLAIARGISDDDDRKSSALKAIAIELNKQGQVEESASVMREARDCNLEEFFNEGPDTFLPRNFGRFGFGKEKQDSTFELSRQSNIRVSALLIQESLAIARGIRNDDQKSNALKVISVELIKQGRVEESLSIARGINDEIWKCCALGEIAVEMSKQGRGSESSAIARGIGDERIKSLVLTLIALELSKLGQMEVSASMLQESLAIARGTPDSAEKSRVLTFIAEELSKQGQVEESASMMQESLEIVQEVVSNYFVEELTEFLVGLTKLGQVEASLAIIRKISSSTFISSNEIGVALKDIAVELSKQGQAEESLAIARGIIDDWAKSSALKHIAVELSKQGQVDESSAVMQESLAIARGISDDKKKSRSLSEIALELCKQGQVEESASVMQESLSIARGISTDYLKSSALKSIAVELSQQGNWTMTESVLLEVSLAGERHEGWQEIAKAVVEAEGWQKALRQAMNFQGEEARLFYSKGWSRQVGITDVDDACVREALSLLEDDPESIQSLLEKYAIRLVSMGTPTKALEGRLNRTLNIQWLLDITANYPNSATHDRLSTNLEEWLHEIPDEDDREQITLWARQVVKGRLTESEFTERLKDINSN